MSNQQQNLPKIPPCQYQDAPPPNRGAPPPPAVSLNNYSERGLLSAIILLISSLSLGIALMGGAWVGIGILQNGLSETEGWFARFAAIALAYLVGWIVGLVGIRKLRTRILPQVATVYAWITLAGMCALQIAIISKLFKQEYSPYKFVLYLILYGAGLIALVGIHLLLEGHNLVPFSFPILLISLAHLYLIVLHYVFIPDAIVNYNYLWGDATFFLVTAVLGVFMLAHIGIFSTVRTRIDLISENTDQFIPPS